ncbi:unnamed protein product [Rotaria sordida]|uniref:Uncharacterized protein n=1 Tax=Rotaria sordida TaxID=392033 RepID=A0A819U3V0_9BILA|nr:unnamed protein product [Rotaria sordida]
MERILLASDYANLTSLELFDSGKEIFSHYTMDNSVFVEHIFKHQITNLIVHFNDEYFNNNSMSIYNEQHLIFDTSSIHNYPPLTFIHLPSTIYFSSTLTVLCIHVGTFKDCLLILDGRLKQLTTFNVQIYYIDYPSKVSNIDKLQHLKCFSLVSFKATYKYNELIVPLLRRMTHLEKLTLNICINTSNESIDETSQFVDGTHLQNKILIYMPYLHTFNFYINTKVLLRFSNYRKFNDSIQQIFTNIKYEQTNCMVYTFDYESICYAYSLPLRFTHLSRITNHFPNIGSDIVTHLYVSDCVPMKHEFFMRINQTFPLLKYFSLKNNCSQSLCFDLWISDENLSNSIIEYSNLISLDIMEADKDYIAQFLLETKTFLPHLTELKVNYDQLEIVTRCFTRDTMRRNCLKVKRLIVEKYVSKHVFQYFPSLLNENCIISE